jgi:hydrogenase maturation protein HypF
MPDMKQVTVERLRISLHGDVQGFGFRPTVYRIADSLRLSGWVRNTTAGMEIEVEGDAERLNKFLAQLTANRPQAAVITDEEIIRIAPSGSVGFEILISNDASSAVSVLPQ